MFLFEHDKIPGKKKEVLIGGLNYFKQDGSYIIIINGFKNLFHNQRDLFGQVPSAHIDEADI